MSVTVHPGAVRDWGVGRKLLNLREVLSSDFNLAGRCGIFSGLYIEGQSALNGKEI